MSDREDYDRQLNEHIRNGSWAPLPPKEPPPHERAWLLVYEDPDREQCVFIGADAEDAARRCFDQARAAWTCRLFAEVDSTGYRPEQRSEEPPRPSEPSAEDMRTASKTLGHGWCEDSECQSCCAVASLIVGVRRAAKEEALIALRPFAEEGRDLTNLMCHEGICTAEECGRCSLVIAARKALA